MASFQYKWKRNLYWNQTIWLQKEAVQTILHTKSSGPNGWAGLEYKKCLEYWDKWKQIM